METYPACWPKMLEHETRVRDVDWTFALKGDTIAAASLSVKSTGLTITGETILAGSKKTQAVLTGSPGLYDVSHKVTTVTSAEILEVVIQQEIVDSPVAH